MAKKKELTQKKKKASAKSPQAANRWMPKDSAKTILRTGALLADLPYVYVCWMYHGTPTAFVRNVEQTLVEHLSRISTSGQLVSLRDRLQGLSGEIDRYFGESGNNQLVEEMLRLRGLRATPDLDLQINELVSRASPNFIQTPCDLFRDSVMSSFSISWQRGLAFALSIHRDHQLGWPSNIETFLVELLQNTIQPDCWLEHQSREDGPCPRSPGEMAPQVWYPPPLTVESLSRHLFRHVDSAEPVGDGLAQILLTNLRPILGSRATDNSVALPEPPDFCRLSMGECLNWIVRWLFVLDCQSDCDQLLAELRSDIQYDDHDLSYDRDRGILRRRGVDDPIQLTGDAKVLFEMFYPIGTESVSLSQIRRTRSRMNRSVRRPAIDQSLGAFRGLIQPLRLRLENLRNTGWRIEVDPV